MRHNARGPDSPNTVRRTQDNLPELAKDDQNEGHMAASARIGLLVGLVAAGCAPGAATTDLSEMDRAAIRALDERFRTVVLARDWVGLEALYKSDAMLLPPNADAVRGAQAIAKRFASTGLEIKEFTTRSEHIAGHSGRATNRGTYTLVFAVVGNPTPVRDPGKYVWVLERQPDGSWRITIDIWNSNAPAA